MERIVRLFMLLATLMSARASVVINEIFYHAPEDLTDLQWVELYNPDDAPVNLAGWNFTKGIRFTFPDGASLPGHGFAVLCRNRELFKEFYDVPVVGQFEKNIRKGGERIELCDATGEVVDSVRFDDHAPWPTGADGLSASLERICATVPGGLPANWSGSPLSVDGRKPGGTPGKPNSFTAPAQPPEITKVTYPQDRAEPGQPITVEADIGSDTGLRAVSLRYRVAGIGIPGDELAVPMTNFVNQRFRGTIPGQDAGRIVRFRIHAADQQGVVRTYPQENEPRPALSVLVLTNLSPGRIPFGYVIHTEPTRVSGGQPEGFGPGFGGPNEEEQARFIIRMQLGMMLDLPALWSSLTLTNVAAGTDPELLRSAFASKMREREQLEEQLVGSADIRAVMQTIPDQVKSFRDEVAKAIKPLLASGQLATLEAWRNRPAWGPGFFGRNPERVLRQLVPLESTYLFLATRTNASPAQFNSIREVFREAIARRDGLTEEVRALMEEDGDRDRFQEKLESIEGTVEGRLKSILTPQAARELAGWREQSRPPTMRGGPGGRRSGAVPGQALHGTSAFIHVDPRTGQTRLFDFVQVIERNGGWKVHFHKDRPLGGLTSINLIFERTERWVLSEPLAYEFYRRVGAAAPLTDFVRLWIDGAPVGYHLLIEQPNKGFLRRNGLRDDGDLFKLLWYERGIVGQHEKKTNPHTGHTELLALVDRLEQTKTNPVVQWELIRKEFDAEQVLTHYAIRMLLSDWDGYFNNYFTYHDLHGTRKWTLYPWDQDQTWGDSGGGQVSSLLVGMPLNFGSEGARPPGARADRPAPTRFMGPGAGGGPGWWRPGGVFSRPLLANPIFRRHFLECLKELIESQFNEGTIFPWIDRMQDQLNDEVRFRAEVFREDPDASLDRFRRNLDSLKQFVVERRKWLLSQEELRNAGAFDRTVLR